MAEESNRKALIEALGASQRLVIHEEKGMRAIRRASPSGGDTWSRVSQRQICAGVCHLKWPPTPHPGALVRRGMKIIKRTGVRVKPVCGRGGPAALRELQGPRVA